MSSLLQWIAQACFEIYSNNDFLKYLIFLEIKLRITKSYVNEKKKKKEHFPVWRATSCHVIS